jgi:hypothetical protein
MARISLGKALASCGVGLLDIGTEELDEYMEWTEPFVRSTDYVRIVVCGGSLAANLLRIEENYSEATFYASLPLVKKSLRDLVKQTFVVKRRVRRGGPVKTGETKKGEFKKVEITALGATPPETKPQTVEMI